ncbi:MAG: SLC13 family permease [Candidatus Lokiarchaeota archaeon]|nr:SLC13 family permease [Candidatus Lokiarchaeota archaeon]
MVFAVLAVTLVLFVVNRWRYDVVALFALLTIALVGLIPFDQVFLGFGHPAVITVAAVLVINRGLVNSGFVDIIINWTLRVGDNMVFQILTLTGLVTVLSAFMNNVGALALLMPVAIRMARKSGKSPSLFLMPLAFCSMLGGMITLIGTPPNIIIATLRGQYGVEPFLMFDFTPVGLSVALAGFLFMSLVGWRLVPQREGEKVEPFSLVEDYITEVYVPEGSKMVGKRIRDLESAAEADVAVISLVREDEHFRSPSIMRGLKAGDSLVVRGEATDLKMLIDAGELRLIEREGSDRGVLSQDDLHVVEAVITTGSPLSGKTARQLKMRSRFGVDLLAVSRQGRRLRARIGDIRLRSGDTLLLHGQPEEMSEILTELGCLPLAERHIRLGKPRRALSAIIIFGAALAATAIGLLPIQVSFVLAAVGMVVLGFVSPDEAYKSINWSVIVLLAAMIPVGHALETTGGAQLIGDMFLEVGGILPPAAFIVILMVATMLLSCAVDNTAAVVLMAPIGVSIALALGVSIDSFLMAVSIGGSSAFLTPIADQSHALVMGPGGYRFTDYLRLGLPLQIIISLLATPLILWFWPL